MKEITAVIVNYKTEDLLRVALSGLLKCYPSLLVILVDNASGDASTEYIEQMVREHSNISAILNRPNPFPPQPLPRDQLPGSYPGDKPALKIWQSGNVGHGAALHQAIQLCKTSYIFTFDTDCVIHRCGFLEGMLEEFDDSLVYAVGYLHTGPLAQHYRAKAPQIHPSIALFDVEKYKSLHPFVHFGGIGTLNFMDAQKKGYKCVDFPVGGKSRRHTDNHDDYIDHLFRGSRKRMKKIPHLRSKPMRPEVMLYGIRTEYIGDYFKENG